MFCHFPSLILSSSVSGWVMEGQPASKNRINYSQRFPFVTGEKINSRVQPDSTDSPAK